jgi:hypothetical protein
MAIDLKKSSTSRGIIKLELARKREILLREKQLDNIVEQKVNGTYIGSIKDFCDMKPFIERTKKKRKYLRDKHLIK